MAKMEEESFRRVVEQAVNSVFGVAGRGSMKMVLDTSGVDLDLNRDRNRKKNEDYTAKEPLLFLIYPANTHESQIFEEVLETLKSKGILKKG